MKLYEEGFQRERESREKTIKEMKEMRGKLDALEKDKRELRQQLNRHAANQFQHEFSEVYTRVNDMGVSTYSWCCYYCAIGL